MAFRAIASVAWVFLFGCHRDSDLAQGQVLSRGLSGEPATLDPGSAADTFSTSVLRDLYEGLTIETAHGDIAPGVADTWTIDATGTQYTFHIRSDAMWSNGRSVRAPEFVSSWQREVDPHFGSPSSDDLRLVAHASEIIAGEKPPGALGVFAPTDSTLIVRLERPAVYFLQILAHPSTFPIYSEVAAKSTQAARWVSNGPYTLESWQPTTTIVLKANPYYWDRRDVHINEVRYKFIADEASQYARYRDDEIDITDTVPAGALPTLRKERPSELVITPFVATCYYGINLTNTAYSNVALRQALAMAIDRKRLVMSLGFGQPPAYGFVPPHTSNYSPQTWNWLELADSERIATARDLYAKAGFSRNTPLHLRLLFNENEVIRRTAILTAAMWREVLGIEVELVSEEYKVFLQSRADKSRWEIARLAWNADFNDASNFLDVLRTRSPNNDMAYSNPQFDSLLDKASATLDVAQRREELEAAERMMLADYPIIPLYHFVTKRLVKPYIRGVQPNPLNHYPSRALSFQR